MSYVFSKKDIPIFRQTLNLCSLMHHLTTDKTGCNTGDTLVFLEISFTFLFELVSSHMRISEPINNCTLHLKSLSFI